MIVSWNFLATDAEFLAATLPDGEHAREQEAGGRSKKSKRRDLVGRGRLTARQKEPFIRESWNPNEQARSKMHGGTSGCDSIFRKPSDQEVRSAITVIWGLLRRVSSVRERTFVQVWVATKVGVC